MYKLVVLALLVAVASAGIVDPPERCPAQGNLLQLRVTDCEGAPPCQIPNDTEIVIEADFIPSANAANANFRFVVETSLGPVVVFDFEIGALVGDVPYTITTSFRVSSAFVGQHVVPELHVYVIVNSTERKELCVRVPMDVV